MKKQIFNIANIKVYATAVLTAAIITCSFTQASASEKLNKENKAKISYVNTQDDLITFNVNFNNPTGEACMLVLSDEQGQVFYQKKFDDKVFNKNVLVRSVSDNAKVIITVKSPSTTTTQSFDINTYTRFVQEIIVTKQ